MPRGTEPLPNSSRTSRPSGDFPSVAKSPGSVRLIKSRSNGRLLEAAAEFLASHHESLVITPGHSAGEELVHNAEGLAGTHPSRGNAGVQRATLVQLAADLARPAMAHLGLAPLTSLGLEALAARAVYRAREEPEQKHALNYFKPVAALPGFARALARTLSELRLARVDTDALAASGAPGADLASLLELYEDELDGRALADLARVFELASRAAESDGHRLLGLPLLLLDAPLDSEAHREFFARVAARAPVILAAVGSDSESANHKWMEQTLGVSAEDLDAANPPRTTLEHLRKYLFCEQTPPPEQAAPGYCDGLEIFSAPGEGLEAVEIARRILRLTRDGVAFDQIAILLRSPERHQPMIEDALRRASIPAYFSRGSARPDPGGRAFLALLACAAEKCSASRFAEYLSLGQAPAIDAARQNEWVPADDELLPKDPPVGGDPEMDAAHQTTSDARIVPAPAAWEKLLVDAAVIGGRERWQRRLRGLEREYELRLKTIERDDEARRDYYARKLDQIRQLEGFALPLIDILDALPRDGTTLPGAHPRGVSWKTWIEKLGELARAALRHPEPVLATLAEFEPMGDVGPVSLEEVSEVLSDRLRFLRSEPPDRRYGHVFIGSIDEARGREFGVVFLPGLAEGIFPRRAFEDPLLLDEFRRKIAATFPQTSLTLRDDRVDQERARLKLAAAAARDRLIASFPRLDVAEARPCVPSFYALELPRAAEGKLPELKTFERDASSAAPARLNWPAPADPIDAIDDVEYDLVALRNALKPEGKSIGTRYLVESNDKLARSLRARYRRWDKRNWSEADGLITHNPDTLAALSTHRLNARAWSPSSLQQFAACPYRFALHGIYGLRPREDAAPIEQLDPLTRGGLFHAVQFALLNELKNRGLLPVKPQSLAETLQIADAALDRTAAEYEEELAPAIPRVWKSEIEDLRTDLRGWLQHVSANDDDWEPIHFEFAFGLAHREDSDHDPASTAEEADLADCGVRLRGSIDLIERHVTTGALRVTDHKTGKQPATIPLYVGGGRLLQPLLYALAAAKLIGKSVESGRLFYATQQGSYQHSVIQVNDKSRAFLTKLLANIDGAIAAGFLPPAPQKDACEWCDYRPVCGRHEEQRTSAQKKDGRDERLDPLTEIRAMP
jgi:ATP-dependent helicase/nuclease subunit B